MNIEDFIRYPKQQNEAYFKARRYINKNTGQVITRRDYQTLTKSGIKPEEIARIRAEANVNNRGSGKLRKHSKLVDIYKKKTADKLGIKPSQVKVRGNSADAIKFRDAVKRLKEHDRREKKLGIKAGDRTPQQIEELKKILEDLNMRKIGDDIAPGNSPAADSVD